MPRALDIEIQTPVKLNLDHEPVKQPEGTYRFALNTVTNREHTSSSVNERGADLCVELPGSMVGSITTDRFNKVIFTNDNSISILDTRSCEISIEVTHPELNFSTDNPITGQFRVVRGCERVVYWRDSLNGDRFFNFDRPEEFKKPNGDWDINKFQFNPKLIHPKITRQILSSGGRLRYGNYHFTVEFLDDLENILFTSQVDINYTPITDTQNFGALNIDSNLPEIGGQPLSSKSIKLTISNITEIATLARIIVFRTTTGNGFTADAHVIGNLIPITGSTIEFVYQGFNPDNGDFLVDKNEFLDIGIVYQTSKVMEQTQNRLIRANLVESIRDFSNYQKFSSRVCTKYLVDEVNKNDANIYYLNRTYLGGEVIALGIVYVHDDGSISPEFHIPGRNNISSDNSVVPVTVEGQTEVSYEITSIQRTNASSFSTVSFIYNFSQPIPNLNFNVIIGSEQQSANPATTTSGGVSFIFSTAISTSSGGTIEIYSGSTLLESVLFTFSNPNSSGTFTMFQTQNLPKWKVLDTSMKDATPEAGYVSSGKLGYYNTDQLYQNPPNYCNQDSYWGIDCDGEPLLNNLVRHHVIPDRSAEKLVTTNSIRTIGLQFSNIDYPNENVIGHYFVVSCRDSFNTNIVAKGILFPFSCVGECDQGRYIHNVDTNTFGTEPLAYNLVTSDFLALNKYVDGEYVLEEGYFDESIITQNKTYDDIFDSDLPYSDLELTKHQHNIGEYSTGTNEYRNVQDSINIAPRSEFKSLENRSFSNPFNVLQTNSAFSVDNPIKYTSVRKIVTVFPDVWNIRFRRITNLNENVSFTGDAFVSRFEFVNISWMNVADRNFFQTITFKDADVKAEFELFRELYLESTVNNYIRHSGTDNCNKIYDRTLESNELVRLKITEPFQEKLKVRSSICEFFPGYNPDYSRVSDFNKYLPLRFTFNFCSKCFGEYPNRIIFSQTSFGNDLSDNYRVFLPNDFVDIPSNTGQIIAIEYKDNRLIVRTEFSCYFLVPNAQQIELNESTAFLGTGDFLSIPPQELNIVEIGYGGQQHILEHVNTDHGLVWIDRQRGKVLNTSGKLEELSRNGMYDWFLKNLPGEDHCILSYDPSSERVIITKTNNWTISYCFITQGWKSWHSYIPNHYMYGIDTFYSEYNNKIWKYNSKEFTKYFDLEFPHIIEFTVRSLVGNAFHIDSVYFFSKCSEFNGELFVDDINTTFDKILVYNEKQSTGEKELRILQNSVDNIYYNPEILYAIESDREYNVSPILDFSTTDTIFTTDITPIKQGDQGYIDKLPTNMDITIEQSEQSRFHGRFASIRLFFNTHDRKIVTDILQALKHYQIGE